VDYRVTEMLPAASSSFFQSGSGGSSSSGSIGKDMGPWMGQTWTWAWESRAPLSRARPSPVRSVAVEISQLGDDVLPYPFDRYF